MYFLNWPYPRDTFAINDTLFEESKAAQETGKSTWHYYSPDSEEYAQHLRIKLSFEADVTFAQFHSKGTPSFLCRRLFLDCES